MSQRDTSVLPAFGCLVLTCFVVHTCVRIEILNARRGYYLPRTDFGSGNWKWRAAAETSVRHHEERMIAQARQAEFQASHPDQETPDESAFRGPPYSPAERATIDAEVDHARRNSVLRDWVRSMGLLQYLLAPAALLWSVAILTFERSVRSRSFLAAAAY